MRKKLSFKGIILGAIVDVGGSSVWGLIIAIYIISSYHITQFSYAEQNSRVLEIMMKDPFIYTLNLVVGSAFSVLGGYLAARIAKHNELLNATLSSFLCEISGLFSFGSAPLWMILLSLIINPLLNLGGGYLHLLQSQKKNKKKNGSK